jgi:hypothetical protein
MKHARDDYNRIQDPAGLIPEDEPVFLLRAQGAEHGINWDGLAADYCYANTEEERELAFEMIRQCVAVDLPDEADETEGAITFLRNRGLWQD